MGEVFALSGDSEDSVTIIFITNSTTSATLQFYKWKEGEKNGWVSFFLVLEKGAFYGD